MIPLPYPKVKKKVFFRKTPDLSSNWFIKHVGADVVIGPYGRDH
jgi:hypothetical protein